MKRFACSVGARTLATINECRGDFRCVLVVPVRPIAKFPIVLSVGRHQRARPTLPGDVISIDQRLKSGAEIDQFGVEGLRGPSLRCSDRKGGNSAAGSDGE
jgi:hypothetical protein